MKMMISIRVVRSYGNTTAGYVADTSLGLCVKLALIAGSGNGDTEDTGVSGLCFFTTSQAAAARTPATDANNNGFKTVTGTYQSLSLHKPAGFASNGVVG